MPSSDTQRVIIEFPSVTCWSCELSGEGQPTHRQDGSVSQLKRWCKPPLSRYPGLYQVQTGFKPGGSYQKGGVHTRGFIPASPHEKDRLRHTSR